MSEANIDIGIDDIINYQTEHVCMSGLSVPDLEKVYMAM